MLESSNVLFIAEENIFNRIASIARFLITHIHSRSSSFISQQQKITDYFLQQQQQKQRQSTGVLFVIQVTNIKMTRLNYIVTLSLFFCSHFAIDTATAQAQQEEESSGTCSLCVGGAPANLTKFIGGGTEGVSCGDVATNVILSEDGCFSLQLQGYRYCDCPDYPRDYFCPMCENAFMDIPNRFKTIPGTEDSCDEKLFVRASEVDGDCEEAMKPGFVCGCPGAEEPECKICNGNSNAISNPDAQLVISGVGSFTCQELVDQALLGSLDMEQCVLVQAEAFTACGCMETTDGNEEIPVEDNEDGTTTSPAESTNVSVESDGEEEPPADDSGSMDSRRNMVALGVTVAICLLQMIFLS